MSEYDDFGSFEEAKTHEINKTDETNWILNSSASPSTINQFNALTKKDIQNLISAEVEHKLLKINENFNYVLNEMEQKYERRLVTIQEQLIRHNESELESFEIKLMSKINTRLNHILSSPMDQLTMDLKENCEKQLKNEIINFKEQIKSSIEQEKLILKDELNFKLEKLKNRYDDREKSINCLYKKQLNHIGKFLDHAKEQTNLMSDHIQKQIECASTINFQVNEEFDDEKLLNLFS